MKKKSEADCYAYVNYQSNLSKKKYLKEADNCDKVYAKNRAYQKKKTRQEESNPIIKAYVNRVRDKLKVRKLVTSLPSLDINDLAKRAKNKA